MPWVNQEICVGCGVCIDECPSDAITMDSNDCAVIDNAKCIRCGRCHDVCPQDAVRHDSERIPQEVADNLRWVRGLLENFQQPEEQRAFIGRMTRHFKMRKEVAERTLATLKTDTDNPIDAIDAAIESTSQ